MKRMFLMLIWLLLLCCSLVYILSFCQKRKLDLTQDFHEFYNMPNDQMAFNSGFQARLFSIKQENATKPKIIIDLCAIYDDANSFYQTTYSWMCLESETKKADLRKIGEYFDSFAKSNGIKNYYLYIVFNTACGEEIYDYQTDELTISPYYDMLKTNYKNYGFFRNKSSKEIDILSDGTFYVLSVDESHICSYSSKKIVDNIDKTITLYTCRHCPDTYTEETLQEYGGFDHYIIEDRGVRKRESNIPPREYYEFLADVNVHKSFLCAVIYFFDINGNKIGYAHTEVSGGTIEIEFEKGSDDFPWWDCHEYRWKLQYGCPAGKENTYIPIQ